MSLLQLVARRATHHCRNESVIASLRSQSHRTNARCSIQLLHGISFRSQHDDRAPVARSLSVSRQIRDRTHHVFVPADSSPYFRYAPVDLPHLSSNSRRHFSSPAPQKEVQHLSSISSDDLQSDKMGKDVPTPTAPTSEPDKAAAKATSSSSSKPESIEEAKPKVTMVEKKETTIVKKAKDLTTWAIKSLIALLAKTPGVLWFYMTNPTEFRKKLVELKEMAVKEAHHYWMGSKVSYFLLSITNEF